MKRYAIYDSRYLTDEDRATCFEVCETLKQARKNKSDYGDGNVIVEETLERVGATNTFNVTNSKIVG